MKTFICWISLFSTSMLFAQPLSDGNDKFLTLSERYQQMKSSSETYADYKVIKEYLLDQTWRNFNDSLKESKAILQQKNTEILGLQTELQKIQTQWKVKEESINELEFYGTHIAFLGIDFGKKTFITIVLILFAGLLALSGLVGIQLKSMHRNQRDRADVMNSLSHEYEEYKRKALEKQTKLSRELQNERNRVMEMKKV